MTSASDGGTAEDQEAGMKTALGSCTSTLPLMLAGQRLVTKRRHADFDFAAR
jgi:hypothetical protein